MGLVGPVTTLLNPLFDTLAPVVDLLPIDLGQLLQTLGVCMNPRPDPELEKEIASYRKGDRQACCQAEHFPRIFTAVAKLSACIKNTFEGSARTICDLLSILNPITGCKGCQNEHNLGCLLKSLLGPIFGKIGRSLVRYFA